MPGAQPGSTYRADIGTQVCWFPMLCALHILFLSISYFLNSEHSGNTNLGPSEIGWISRFAKFTQKTWWDESKNSGFKS